MDRIMRARWFALLVVVIMPLLLLPQDLPEPSFVLKIAYTTVDLPRSVSTTCLAVFPDGRFHMEHLSEWPGDRPRIFEDSLPNESLKSLSTILEAQELKQLRAVESQEISGQGDMVWGVISRGDTTQKLGASAWDASAGRPRKPFPAPLTPLLQWVETTTKVLDRNKLPPLKKSKPVNCWLGAGKANRRRTD
jgi:hypothetical protein